MQAAQEPDEAPEQAAGSAITAPGASPKGVPPPGAAEEEIVPAPMQGGGLLPGADD